MTLEHILKEKLGEILHLAAKYGARNVRVCGSVSRSEADEQSDIDFLVEMDAGRSLFDFAVSSTNWSACWVVRWMWCNPTGLEGAHSQPGTCGAKPL